MSSAEVTALDQRLPSQVAAAETRRRGEQFRTSIRPDKTHRADGGLLGRPAYDESSPAPQTEVDEVLERLQGLDIPETQRWIEERVPKIYRRGVKNQRALLAATSALLAWLCRFPGSTWNERWVSSGLDAAPIGSVEELSNITGRPHQDVASALTMLVESRVVRPSYSWLLTSRNYRRAPSARFLEATEPEALERIRSMPVYLRAPENSQRNAETCIARILIRTGKRIGALRGEDVLSYANIVRTSGRHNKEHLAWELLVLLGPLSGESPTLRAAWSAAGNSRQHTVEGLVARYGIPVSGVKTLLVDYLGEVKTGMDYGSLEAMAYRLVRLFWAEILDINPQQADLRISPEVATEWRERVNRTLDGRKRTDISSTYFTVRAFYRDLADWSHEQPERWAHWVAPSPLPRHESRQISKANTQRRSRMQARTRALTPLLPRFMEAVAAMRASGERTLTAALATPHGETFVVDGETYVRHDPKTQSPRLGRNLVWAMRGSHLSGGPPATGYISVSSVERDGFWAWAVANVLQQTGLRIEELLELTQLSIRHYVAPTTNTIVPLLHVVPSKTDAERLVPMTPDLVKILVEVQRRARGTGQAIPLSVRYDPSERVFSEPLPHLFARMNGPTQNVLSIQYVRKVLSMAADRAGLSDGPNPVSFTPHDFRRLFATDLVGSGLPLHIVSTLMGHLNLETTRGYTAVFPEEVIQAHHAFIERRRQTRPSSEFRSADPEEWTDFEQHFLLRKVALGNCHRPYATPCVHEHACIKCKFLQVDPDQLPRIEEMTANAQERLAEAQDKVWLGEVSSLEDSLLHLRRRRDEAIKLSEAAIDAGIISKS